MECTWHDLGADCRARAFSTQRGEPLGAYGSFNLTHYCGDSPAHVAACREELAEELGLSPAHIILPHQTHDTEVRAVTSGTRTDELEGIDAVMTGEAGLCIGVSTADCIPVLLYDPAHHAAAAIHAGWRGTVGRIVTKAVNAMHDTYASRPETLRAVIGPGISEAAFEVGDEVYEAFREAGFRMADIATRHAKWHIDLPRANALTLAEAGVRPENIRDCGICTYASPQTWFSARRLGIHSGRIYTGIILDK